MARRVSCTDGACDGTHGSAVDVSEDGFEVTWTGCIGNDEGACRALNLPASSLCLTKLPPGRILLVINIPDRGKRHALCCFGRRRDAQ